MHALIEHVNERFVVVMVTIMNVNMHQLYVIFGFCRISSY